ncbi:MAG: 50S ribosomal protein L5 [Ignavibacteriae bacterium]|nr:50S ribosomal protein L5 [Ignavibacteriota bacterium]
MAEKTKKATKKEAPKEQEATVKVTPRLHDKYKNEIVPSLMKQFSYKSIMQVPKLDKIVINMGLGDAVQDSKVLDEAVKDLETITGQKASIRTAKKAISNFKLREGMKIGAKVTLRRDRMYEFLDRLITIAMPRIRDFRGVSDKSFDGRGNYTLGLKEQIIFPEINIDKVTRVLGMDITFVIKSGNDQESFELLKSFGFPFKKKEINNA